MMAAGMSLAAALAAQPAAPVPAARVRTEVPFEAARILVRPSASVRHALLASGPAIPAGGIAFTARCLVARSNGRAFSCEAPDAPEAWRAAAGDIAAFYQFELGGLQFGPDEGTGTVTIADRIVPEDVRLPASLFRFTASGAGNPTFTTGFGLAVMAYYPVSALRGGDEALINVDCQVQPDLSLFCLNAVFARGSPSTRSLGAFQLATYQIMGSARVAPTMDNGASAVGTVFRRTLAFRIPAE